MKEIKNILQKTKKEMLDTFRADSYSCWLIELAFDQLDDNIERRSIDDRQIISDTE